MTVLNQNIKIRRGDTATVFVALTMADGSAFDPAIDVQIRWRMARTAYSTDLQTLSRKSLGDGIELATGGIDITLDVDDTDYPAGLYYHELKIWDVGDVATAMTGTFIVKSSLRMGDLMEPAAPVLSLSGEVPVPVVA